MTSRARKPDLGRLTVLTGSTILEARKGLHSLEILIATHLSGRDGRRVQLPLQY